MPTSLTVHPDVQARFSDMRVELVVATGLDNTGHWPEAESALAATEADAGTGAITWSEDEPAIATWHAAYRAFGTNPRRTRPSVDALLRRLVRQGRLPRVNGAVDAYNATSVRFAVPAGAFDLDRLGAHVEIRPATPEDRFTPLGEPDEVEVPGVGEVVYAQGTEVLTRHWNHRDSHATRVQESTTSAVFMLERISADVPAERLTDAAAHLTALLAPHAASVTTATLTADAPVAHLATRHAVQ
ncbi:DNA/RNA-binding domain of Phe-tRNA-synthetase-like protein [Pseudonocardia hierapolitana]|uniref:DNA/RNA-binding domain of Phe-tRNA-synthetase-like protein n=1 Tax=Pseudonocardia hierapolitana TaxID=1128676 RepID=A0A561SX19_9PSEU|nr:phenylalanine--tRNA ligase beta subunit-related protein [Pseudonocardia hierapolitana]TWF79413.1 DNA/RNA-binding domain of Phe-tRNA-synthetase-like protein [Pseudonocardia hierapolitana]